jgi:hypothetical protein
MHTGPPVADINDCQDPEELAILKEEGGHRSGNQLRVINAIADAVKDEWPGVLIDTFAYEQTTRPPAFTKPRDNVIIRIATTWCDSFLPINGTRSNKVDADRIMSWSNISKQLSIWDYTANCEHSVPLNLHLGISTCTLASIVCHARE